MTWDYDIEPTYEAILDWERDQLDGVDVAHRYTEVVVVEQIAHSMMLELERLVVECHTKGLSAKEMGLA